MKRNGHDKYNVHLSDKYLEEIEAITRKGKHRSRVIIRANILKAAHEGKLDKEVCQEFGVDRSTVHDIRKHFVQGGLSRALYDAPRPGQPRKLNGTQEAKVVAIACTKAPKGYHHWTLDLLTGEVNNQGMAIGRTAIWKILLRNDTKPWRKKMWVISRITPEFERKMNDVLEVYGRPYDPKNPVLTFPLCCFNKISCGFPRDTP